MVPSTDLIACRQYRVVTLFAKSPPRDRDISDWYHPIENFNAVLCRARRLGLYRDEHLVRRHGYKKGRSTSW